LNIYLEATVGDNNTSKPDMFDLRGKYKWNAWNANKGKNKEIAQQEYIALVRQLQSKL
jgi:diazepam-binding inhibitor (GABA receptor modulating acyl-CoA-binding protein)